MALRMLAPDWAEKKSFVLFCPIGVQLLHSRFHVFLHSVCFISHNLILIYTSREIISDVSEKRFRPYDFCPVYFVLPRLTAPGSPRMCTSWPANVKLKGGQNAIWRHADHDDYFRMEKLTTFYQPGCSLTDWWFQTMSRKHWQSSPPPGFTLKVHLHLYILNNVFSFLFAFQMSQYNGNWTEWSAMWYEVIPVISKLNEHAVHVYLKSQVWFQNKTAWHKLQFPLYCIIMASFLIGWKKKDTIKSKNSAIILLKKMALLRANQIILQGSQWFQNGCNK